MNIRLFVVYFSKRDHDQEMDQKHFRVCYIEYPLQGKFEYLTGPVFKWSICVWKQNGNLTTIQKLEILVRYS
jgi:hypothetical protein